jgi:hypothetical protein
VAMPAAGNWVLVGGRRANREESNHCIYSTTPFFKTDPITTDDDTSLKSSQLSTHRLECDCDPDELSAGGIEL